MNALITADLHLTDNPADQYRWNIFKILELLCANSEEAIDAFIIAGDIAHAKDNHSGALVNWVAKAIRRLSDLAPVYIIAGNHDYVDAALPFWQFLDYIPRVHFIRKPATYVIADNPVFFCPHIADRDAFNEQVKKREGAYKLGVFHQTFDGCFGDNGQRLRGMPLTYLDQNAANVSGDIHRPQTVSGLVYAGSPHPVNFGDDWSPRILQYGPGGLTSIPSKSIKKEHIVSDDLLLIMRMVAGYRAGDQFKITVKMQCKDAAKWSKISDRVMEYAKNSKGTLCGLRADFDTDDRRQLISPGYSANNVNVVEFWEQYAIKNNLPSALALRGLALLKEVMDG